MLIEGIKLYFTPTVLVAFCVGISSGLPLALIASTLSAWLTTAGLSKINIGFLLSLNFPYAIKFLWAPFVDFFQIPFLSKKVGNKRAWIIITEIFLFCSITFLGSCDVNNFFLLSISVLVVAFLSATHDIVIDSFRVFILTEHEQGAGASMAVTGYRIGMLISGAGALLLADYLADHGFGTRNWEFTYMIIAFIVFIGGFASFFVPIGDVNKKNNDCDVIDEISANFKNLIFLPFKEFIDNNIKWLNIILFIVFFRLADAFIGAMFNPFLIDKGFTLTEIGLVVKSFGFFATIFGAFLGGYVTYYFSINHALLFAVSFQIFGNIMFIIQNNVGHSVLFLYFLVCIDNVSGSISTSAMMAYIAIICKSAKYLATQYAFLTSLSVLDRVFVPAFAGIVASFGWMYFFICGIILSIPSLISFIALNYNKPDILS